MAESSWGLKIQLPGTPDVPSEGEASSPEPTPAVRRMAPPPPAPVVPSASQAGWNELKGEAASSRLNTKMTGSFEGAISDIDLDGAKRKSMRAGASMDGGAEDLLAQMNGKTQSKGILKGDAAQTAQPPGAHAAGMPLWSSLPLPWGKRSRHIKTGILLTPEKRLLRKGRDRRRHVHFHLPKNAAAKCIPIMEPTSNPVQKWQVVMVIPMVYEAWAFPYRLALSEPHLFGGTLITDLIADFFFVVDACVSMYVAVPVKQSVKNEEVMLSRDMKVIALRYFTRKFPIQVLPSIGLYAVTAFVSDLVTYRCTENNQCVLDTSTWVVWLWWAATLFRFFPRIWRLLVYWSNLETNLEVSAGTLQVFKFTMLIFMSCHWVGCIYWWLARLYFLGDTTWVSTTEAQIPLYDRYASDRSMDYVLCLYRGFNSLASLSYNITVPDNTVELLFSLLTYVLQVWVLGVILGTLFHYLAQKDVALEAHKTLLESVERFCVAKELSPELRDRLFKHLHFQHKKKVANQAAASLVLPRSLEIKVADANYRHVIDNCMGRGQVFCNCSPHFIASLLIKLKVSYLMLGEEIIKKGDMSRHLSFVLQGSVQVLEGEKLKRVIHADVIGHPSIISAEAFFFGIAQPNTIRAPLDSEVQILMLDRAGMEDLFHQYPEEQDTIITNLLSSFGLDEFGQEIRKRAGDGSRAGGGGGETETDDVDLQQLKSAIVDSLNARVMETSRLLTHASQAGDVEEVKRLLQHGARVNHANYDGRTVLHMASAQGNAKVVERLLEEGAFKHAVNRWGQTALQEAMANGQTLVVDLLMQWKATVTLDNAAGALCDAASANDIEAVRLLCDNNVDPNKGDYDNRTPLHIAAAFGNDKIVELLLVNKADPNVSDRWGGSPMQDAVSAGNQIVAAFLRRKGGQVSQQWGGTSMCDAANEGDVRMMRMLHDCGIPADRPDYDFRYPLHLAAANARILVVSFLLGISAEPNVKDRWGGTPLDDARRGGTPYHMFCAKLIHGWGGSLGRLAGTKDGERLLYELESIDMAHVRSLIKKLIQKGHEQRSPDRLSSQGLLEHFEACMHLMSHQQNDIKAAMDHGKEILVEQIESAQSFVSLAQMRLDQMVELIDLSLNSNRFAKQAAIRRQGTMTGKAIQEPTQSTFKEVLDRIRESFKEQEQGNDDNAELDDGGGIDTEDELQLHEELDTLIELNEKMEQLGVSLNRYLAITFQKYSLRMVEPQNMFSTLDDFMRKAGEKGQRESQTSSATVLLKDLPKVLSCVAGSEGETKNVDMMFEEVNLYKKEKRKQAGFEDDGDHMSETETIRSVSDVGGKDGERVPRNKVSLRQLVSGSPSFRSMLLELHADPVFCTMCRNPFLNAFLSEGQLKLLAQGATVRHVQKGELLQGEDTLIHKKKMAPMRKYSVATTNSTSDSKGAPAKEHWFMILDGRFVVEMDKRVQNPTVAPMRNEINTWDVFGGYEGLSGSNEQEEFLVRASGPAKVLQLSTSPFQFFAETDNPSATTLMNFMAEYPVPIKKAAIAKHSANGSPGGGSGEPRHASTRQRTLSPKRQGSMKSQFSMKRKGSIGTGLGGDVPELSRRGSVMSEGSFSSRGAGNGSPMFSNYGSPWMASPDMLKSAKSFVTRASIKDPNVNDELQKWQACVGQPPAFETMSSLAAGTQDNEVYGAAKEEPSFQRLPSGSTAKKLRVLTEQERFAIKTAVEMIEDCWRHIAIGCQSVTASQLKAIAGDLGEAGSELFRKLFLTEDIPDEISSNFYWDCWMRFLESEYLESAGLLEDEQEDDRTERTHSDTDSLGTGSMDIDSDEDEEEESGDVLDWLHSKLSSRRRIKRYLFEPDTLERYELAYRAVMGDVKKAISAERIPIFIRELLPHYNHRISRDNVKEILVAFGRDGAHSKNINWAGIQGVLEAEKEGHVEAEAQVMMNGCINPLSKSFAFWMAIMKAVSVYLFIMVPIRIAFDPWSSDMTKTEALSSDLLADVLAFLNIFVLWRTAYKSENGAWVTNKWKIIRNSSISAVLAGFPLDWFAFCIVSGPDMLSLGYRYNWLRVNKMLLPIWIVASKASWGRIDRSNTKARIWNLTFGACALFHISACVWYWIGSQYQYWADPSRQVSWITYHPDLKGKVWDHQAYGLLPAEAFNVWDQYLMAFYWVTTTISGTGLVSEIQPQNTVELLYCIYLMILNLTFFRYVTGEISTIVMQKDEDLAVLRSNKEAVKAFLNGNKLPGELKEEVRNYFGQASSLATVDQADILSRLSHTLKVEIAAQTSRSFLDTAGLFEGCDETLLDEVSVLLTEVQFSPEEYVYRSGELAKDMYIVVHGSVDELQVVPGDGEQMHMVQRVGKSTGVLSFFFKMRHILACRANKSLGAVCLKLDRDHFSHLLKMWPEEEEKVAQNAMKSFESFRAMTAKGGGSKAASDTSGAKSSGLGSEGTSGQSKDIADDDDGSEASHQSADGQGMASTILVLRQRRRADAVNVLLSAAAAGDVDRLKQSLEGEVGPNDTDELGRTALHIAACEGHVEVVKLLLACGAELDLRDKKNNTPINDAIRHKQDLVCEAFKQIVPDCMLTFHGMAGGVAMCEAGWEGDKRHLQRLMDMNISPDQCDYDKRTAMHLASCQGHAEVVQFLLDSKADVNFKDRFGGRPIDDAVRHKQVACQQVLRKHGAALTGMDFGVKLCQAVEESNLEEIKVLIANGVDPSIGDYDQRTALHLASSVGQISVLDYLLNMEPKIGVNPVDRMGGTPLEDAYRHDQAVAISMLERRGGLRQGSKALEQIITRQQHVEMKRRKDYRVPRVQELLLKCPELAFLESVQEAWGRLREALDAYSEATERMSDALEEVAQRFEALMSGTAQSTSKTPGMGMAVTASGTTTFPGSPFKSVGSPASTSSFGELGGVGSLSSAKSSGESPPPAMIEPEAVNPLELCEEVLDAVVQIRDCIRAARKALQVPLPACKLSNIFANEFNSKRSHLLKLIRTQDMIVKMIKKTFKELQNLLRSRKLNFRRAKKWQGAMRKSVAKKNPFNILNLVKLAKAQAAAEAAENEGKDDVGVHHEVDEEGEGESDGDDLGMESDQADNEKDLEEERKEQEKMAGIQDFGEKIKMGMLKKQSESSAKLTTDALKKSTSRKSLNRAPRKPSTRNLVSSRMELVDRSSSSKR